MAPFEDLLKAGLSSLGAEQSNPNPSTSVASGLLELLNNPQTGGIEGLAQNFEQGGLGHLVSSWVGTGQNLPVSADQLQSVLGSDAVKSLAAKAGISPDEAGTLAAQILPQLVDKLSPNGQAPASGNLLAEGMSLLQGIKL
jgi:uncharacterized protein YidB (DUF937 family)